MSELQQEAVRMISGLSDDNIRFLIEVIHRLMPQGDKAEAMVNKDKGMRAFGRLDAARAEIKKFFPDDFDPERELEEARMERYGNID